MNINFRKPTVQMKTVPPFILAEMKVPDMKYIYHVRQYHVVTSFLSKFYKSRLFIPSNNIRTRIGYIILTVTFTVTRRQPPLIIQYELRV